MCPQQKTWRTCKLPRKASSTRHILASPAANARAFVVVDVCGRGMHTPEGDVFVRCVFSGFSDLPGIHLKREHPGWYVASPRRTQAHYTRLPDC